MRGLPNARVEEEAQGKPRGAEWVPDRRIPATASGGTGTAVANDPHCPRWTGRTIRRGLWEELEKQPHGTPLQQEHHDRPA